MKPFLLELAKQSGKILMEHFGRVKFIKSKEGKSYFTNVDLESEELIISMIKKKFSQHSIVSEECGKISKKPEYTWYIDPLDGTHNYIKNFPLFGVSIALEHKGQMKFGVISLPYFNETYFAEKGKGAFLNGKQLSVSSQDKLKKSFVVTDLALRHHPDDKIRMINNLKGRVYDLRVLGCSVYGCAMVAKGSADAYITRYTNSWDIAAGALIIEEANGKVTDLDGSKWNVNKEQFLTTNGKIHEQMLRILE